MTETRLTEYSHGAGCACKLSPAELHQIIEPVRSHDATVHPNLLVGISTSDDAGVYALGDIAGSPPFTHTAHDDHRVIRTNLLDGGDASTRGRLLPYAVFIDPELGRVGMSEREAREKGFEVRIAKLPMTSVARAIERLPSSA